MLQYSLFTLLGLLLIVSHSPLSAEASIHEHGFWIGEEFRHYHKNDYPLADALVDFFLAEDAESVVDFGCGTGDYIRILQHNNIECDGYDGNPDTFFISDGVAKIADLSQPLDLGKTYDWVLSLEVGDNIPQEYEKTFLENIHKHNAKGVVISWAIVGQGGVGHVNEQSNDYIIEQMEAFGYEHDEYAEHKLRLAASFPWFKNTLMVFHKP